MIEQEINMNTNEIKPTPELIRLLQCLEVIGTKDLKLSSVSVKGDATGNLYTVYNKPGSCVSEIFYAAVAQLGYINEKMEIFFSYSDDSVQHFLFRF